MLIDNDFQYQLYHPGEKQSIKKRGPSPNISGPSPSRMTQDKGAAGLARQA
jgi:hypothetical protein